MLRKVQPFFMLWVLVVAMPAAAQEPTDESTGDQQPAEGGTAPAAAEAPTDPSAAEAPADEPAAAVPTPEAESSVQLSAQGSVAPAASPPTAEEKPVEESEGWQTEVHGYFRAPVAMGLSSRPDPETYDATTNVSTAPKHLQVSYGPTRTVDSDYYSFGYTRLQEQDWAEVFIHAKKKHVHAAVGWMGYWLQGAGFRNYDSAWIPGNAYLTLDTDVEVASLSPNVALTVGAWWPGFGAFPKYDTYTLGRFRQVGEQLKLTVPVNPELTVTVVQGFGTVRDGKINREAPAPYLGQVRMDLLHYYNIGVSYDKYVNVGVHYNSEFARDPGIVLLGGTPPRAYGDARKAYLDVLGAEVTLFAPYAGRLWISPSQVAVKNGWALDWAGTEVMHSIGGMGVAFNYMAYYHSPSDSVGSGKMLNLGFLYENTLSNLQGKEPAKEAPEVTGSVFGLMANSKLDLPASTTVTQDQMNQFKWGVDLNFQALDWLGVMARYDQVNYDLDHPGYIFSAITFPRITISSHFLSSESIYIQYSRYRYGDKMTLKAVWPWGSELVMGSRYYQNSVPYKKPDEDVLRLQASIEF